MLLALLQTAADQPAPSQPNTLPVQIVAGVLAVICVVIIVLRRKKKKQNADNDF